MSAVHSAVSCGRSQVSLTAIKNIVLEIIRPVREAFFNELKECYLRPGECCA